MGRETRLFKSEERKKRDEVSNFLHELADKISNGRVLLRQGAEEIVLEIPQDVILEVQVEDEEKGTKGMQRSLEVEIKWSDNEDQNSGLELT